MLHQKTISTYFLKECEWRFNNSDPKSQLNQLNQWVKEMTPWLPRTVPIILLLTQGDPQFLLATKHLQDRAHNSKRRVL